LAFIVLADAAMAQQQASGGSTSPMRQLFALKSSDGRSHEIEAIALGRSGKMDVLYVVELNSEPGRGKDGCYLLWKLDLTGKVLHKEIITKTPNGEPPRVTIIPLPAPQGGAVIVGLFGDQWWSMRQVDDAGKITEPTDLIRGEGRTPVVLPRAKGLLLVGSDGREGKVWQIGLDGNVQWERTYWHEFVAERKPVSRSFYDIALTDDKGGFVVAGEIGELYKMGLGRATVWLVRCDPAGNVVCETTFPDLEKAFVPPEPLMCAIGRDKFVVMHSGWATSEAHDVAFESRVRLVDLQLQKQWEKKVDIYGLAIGSLPSCRGFVVAGLRVRESGTQPRGEYRFLQYNANGQIVSSASSAPLTRAGLLHVTCGESFAYVTGATEGGFDPLEVHEASIWEIPLKK
jgi:hypothetical protein